MRGAASRVALALAALGLAAAAAAQDTPPAASEWRTIEGTMAVSGTVRSLPTEDGRPAGTAHLLGTVVLSAGAELRRAFQTEAVYYTDGHGVMVGRSVWSDDTGDRIFAALKGEPVQTGTRVDGTVTGGTGRYAGLAGEFSFVWQYVITAEPGELAGRTVTLKGRYRRPEAAR